MKASRCAHWLIVPTLALGMTTGPVHAHAAPAKPPREPTAAPKGKAKTGEAPKTGETPKEPQAEGDAPEDETDETPDAESSAPPKAKGKGGAGEAPKTPEGDEPPAEGGEPSSEAEPETSEADAGTEPEPAEPPSTEAPLEPAITLQPRAVEPSLETSSPPSSFASREVVADPRRLRSDERIMFRAGLLAFGVAGAALVPMAVGLHQSAYARRVLDHLETPSEAAARSDVQTYERTMSRMALATGSVAVASAIAGALLVGLGARRARQAPATVGPSLGPGTAGVVIRGRF